MPEVTDSDIAVSSPTLPLSARILRFVDAYVSCRDLEKSAIEVGLDPEKGKSLYRRAVIRAEIDKRIAAVDAETAKLLAKRRVVTVEALDKNLMHIVTMPVKALKEAPALATSKVRAIELGYQRVGLMIDGNFIPDGSSEAAKATEAPRIFRATEQTILTHQVTTQTVTRREVAAVPGVAAHVPVTIEADGEDDPWANF